MRIVCASDLHCNLPEIPPCDLLLLGGDIASLRRNQFQWMKEDLKPWLERIPAKEVVACAGNHDFTLEQEADIVAYLGLRWHYLQDSGIELFGLNIWGTPWQLTFGDLSFNLPETRLDLKWQKIPQNTDILVCHSPPKFIGDVNHRGMHCGSESLTRRIAEIQPKLVVCGHIHPSSGVYEHANAIIVNAALVNEENKLVREPYVFDLIEGRIERVTRI